MAGLISPKPVSYMQNSFQYPPYSARDQPYSRDPRAVSLAPYDTPAPVLQAQHQQLQFASGAGIAVGSGGGAGLGVNTAVSSNVGLGQGSGLAVGGMGVGGVGMQGSVHEESKIYALVIDLLDANTREGALLELSKKREQYDDLALVLWHSFGACSGLSRECYR